MVSGDTHLFDVMKPTLPHAPHLTYGHKSGLHDCTTVGKNSSDLWIISVYCLCAEMKKFKQRIY